MALTKPTLLSQPAFDGDLAQTIIFTVLGGSQVVGNRLKIINNTTGVEVYNQTQSTFKLEHNIPAHTLINGAYYAMQLQTIDAQGNTSPWSNMVQFYCYSAPSLAITNIPVGNIINNSTFNFEATYTQSQNELLNSYKFTLYSINGTELDTSGIKYVGEATLPPTMVSHTFVGLEDNTSYQIEVIGSTINGTSISSGIVTFTADFITPSLFAVLQLENECDKGYISITSNLIAIEGKSNPSPPIYIDNKKVDLRGNGYYVLWDNGFTINDNFTMKIWGEKFNPQKTITMLYDAVNTDNKIIVNFRQDDSQTFAEMYCYQGGTPYYCYSNYMPNPSLTDQVFIWVRRINNVFEIKIENRGVII